MSPLWHNPAVAICIISWFPGLLLKHHGNVSKFARVISLWSHIYLGKQMAVLLVGSRCFQLQDTKLFLESSFVVASEREQLSERRQGIYAAQESAFFLKIPCDSHCISPRFSMKVPTAITFEVVFRNTKINQTCIALQFALGLPRNDHQYIPLTPSQILPCSINTQFSAET